MAVTKAKYEKALDDAFASRMALAFDVLVQGLTAAQTPEAREVSVKTFGATVGNCLEAHTAAMAFAPTPPSKDKTE